MADYVLATSEVVMSFYKIEPDPQNPTRRPVATTIERLDLRQVSKYPSKTVAAMAAQRAGLTIWRHVRIG